MNKIMEELNFCSLSSGSSGNCYYLGYNSGGILIDAGISATAIRKFLKDIGVSMQTIMGILISHNHTDHTRGLEVLARKNNLPAFTTDKVWQSILPHKKYISNDSIRKITLEQKFHLAGFDIEAFPVSHDAPETIGFHIRTGDKTICLATDLGYISQTAAKYMKEAELLIIESNYDEEMLEKGRYPYFLKTRIKSEHGHLSNYQCADFLAENFSDKLRYICLAHLSINNNSPEKALKTLYQTLSDRGIVLNGQQISVLNRNLPSDIIRLSK